MWKNWGKNYRKEVAGRWITWKETSPLPGEYIYGRDFDAIDIVEIAWAVGDADQTQCVVVNDPTLSKITFDQWQLVPPPAD